MLPCSSWPCRAVLPSCPPRSASLAILRRPAMRAARARGAAASKLGEFFLLGRSRIELFARSVFRVSGASGGFGRPPETSKGLWATSVVVVVRLLPLPSEARGPNAGGGGVLSQIIQKAFGCSRGPPPHRGPPLGAVPREEESP